MGALRSLKPVSVGGLRPAHGQPIAPQGQVRREDEIGAAQGGDLAAYLGDGDAGRDLEPGILRAGGTSWTWWPRQRKGFNSRAAHGFGLALPYRVPYGLPYERKISVSR